MKLTFAVLLSVIAGFALGRWLPRGPDGLANVAQMEQAWNSMPAGSCIDFKSTGPVVWAPRGTECFTADEPRETGK